MDDAYYWGPWLWRVSLFLRSKAAVSGVMLGFLYGFDCCLDRNQLYNHAKGF